MTKEPTRRTLSGTQPLLPGLARKAAKDLERPLKTIADATRALEAWFVQNGDPFNALPALVVAEELPVARGFAADDASGKDTLALVATFMGLADEIDRRFTSVREREDC